MRREVVCSVKICTLVPFSAFSTFPNLFRILSICGSTSVFGLNHPITKAADQRASGLGDDLASFALTS